MQQISLIPSFEKVELHSADLVAKDVIGSVSQELQQIKTLANPLTCDSKYLPFLAHAFKVDFWDDNLSIEAKRNLIKESIYLHQKKGTVWAVERVLEILDVKADVQEWFKYGGEPYYFKIKLELVQKFPHINQLVKLIELYKNIRSKYEIDFDLFLDGQFKISNFQKTNIDFENKIILEKELKMFLTSSCNLNHDPHSSLLLSSLFNISLGSNGVLNVDFETKENNIEREVLFVPSFGNTVRLDFKGE